MSLMNKSHVHRLCIHRSCHTCGWVMSHMSMSHVTYEWVTSRMALHTYLEIVLYESCPLWISHMCIGRVWIGHVTHMYGSCHTYEWVMSHIWMRHVTYMNESCHTCEWVMSHMWMSHFTHVNESCHICEWVMSHMWMSDSTYEWIMLHINDNLHMTHIYMYIHVHMYIYI